MINTYKHSGSCGDIILSLPTVIASGGGEYYPNPDFAKRLGRLLEAQPYLKLKILDYADWLKFVPTYNLDLFRGSSKMHIVEMHLDAFKLKFDLSQPWLSGINPKRIAKIVVNDSGGRVDSKFPGYTVNWSLLKPYEKDCVFVGHEAEWNVFKEYRKLNIDFYKVEDLYEWAQLIAGSDLYIGNTTSGFCLAEGMKKTFCIDLYVCKPQFPLTYSSYVGLNDAILYWTCGIPYGDMSGALEQKRGDWKIE